MGLRVFWFEWGSLVVRGSCVWSCGCHDVGEILSIGVIFSIVYFVLCG